ncbi:MAG: cytochrome c [Paucibacter sp.]|nr:cytochrome c [Roseateles sp.]MBV8379952.1 cytochrome c [Roseateles sp.]
MKPARHIALRAALALAGAVCVLAALVAWLNVRGETPLEPGTASPAPSAVLIERGAYLARAGNCVACHTATGGALFAGGRAIDTPFGAVIAPNITPDLATGIGAWSAGDFWRALHNGRSRDGRLLYPAFPYPSFTYVTRADSDALYAYLRSVPPVVRANDANKLRFPFSTQAALALWRALYFRPGAFAPQTGERAAWNRGKYLVQALGHCAACHSARGALGGISHNAEFAGGLMPDASWYAPSLASPSEAGLQGWPRAQVVRLLGSGISEHATVSGPMAEVVYTSTQYLTPADLDAMAEYLDALPRREPEREDVELASGSVLASGGKLYAHHCAECHGDHGQGVAGAYPALAGNRVVTLASPNNLVQMIRHGGFAPATAGNPRPYGMPPYGQALDEDAIAALSTFVRQSWGNSASPVTPLQVLQTR